MCTGHTQFLMGLFNEELLKFLKVTVGRKLLFTEYMIKNVRPFYIHSKCITLEIILKEPNSSFSSFFDKCNVEISCDNVNGWWIQSNISYQGFQNNDEVLICRVCVCIVRAFSLQLTWCHLKKTHHLKRLRFQLLPNVKTGIWSLLPELVRPG